MISKILISAATVFAMLATPVPPLHQLPPGYTAWDGRSDRPAALDDAVISVAYRYFYVTAAPQGTDCRPARTFGLPETSWRHGLGEPNHMWPGLGDVVGYRICMHGPDGWQ